MTFFISRNRHPTEKAYFFAPEGKFDIAFFAAIVIAVMREANVDGYIEFPDGSVGDIEKECTVEELIENYREFMDSQTPVKRASNQNSFSII